MYVHMDRFYGLMVRVPGYRSRDPGFDSRRYQIFWKVVGLERGPLSLVRIIEELLEWKSSGSGQENRINGPWDPLRWPRDTLYPRMLALTSPTSGGHLIGIVHLRTEGHGVQFFMYVRMYACKSTESLRITRQFLTVSIKQINIIIQHLTWCLFCLSHCVDPSTVYDTAQRIFSLLLAVGFHCSLKLIVVLRGLGRGESLSCKSKFLN
jgi:hypothetical protein